MGGDGDDIARRAYLGVNRASLVKTDDSKRLQELTVRDHFGHKKTNVEHWAPFGFTYVPKAPENGQEAEVLVAFVGGNPDHAVAIATADRRYRPKNLKPGESAHHDDQKQISKIGRDGIETTGKAVTITGGGEQPKGDTKDFELNEQLKGLAARVAQAENLIAGQHHVTSKLRENIEQVVPTLIPINAATQVTAILNKLPTGLDGMVGDVAGKAQDYLQKAIQQALQKFLSPNLSGIQSVLGAGLEAQINSLKNQVADLITNNPVVQQVDDLKDELAALAESGGAADVIAAGTAALQKQIDSLVGANPVIGTVQALRAQVEVIADQAGPGLNFLAPQQRLVKGQTRSMRFGG